jgi:CheY-like chemotaxis protein
MSEADLLRYLVEGALISESESRIALAEQRARRSRLVDVLIDSEIVSEDTLLQGLAAVTRLPSLTQGEILAMRPLTEIITRFPKNAAERLTVLPIWLNVERSSARIIVADPFERSAVEYVKRALDVKNEILILATRSTINSAIQAWYSRPVEESVSQRFSLDPPTRKQAVSVPAGALIAIPASPPPAPIAPPREPPKPKKKGALPVVLIADRDPNVLSQLAGGLDGYDCEVLTAQEGTKARAFVEEKNPSVVFVDAALPRVDGFTILLEVRSQNPDATVYLTSNAGDEFRQAKALELGADDFFVKPFSTQVIVAKLRREIQKRWDEKPAAPSSSPPAQEEQIDGVSGSLARMDILEIVQTLGIGQKTAHIVVDYEDGKHGELRMDSGSLSGCVFEGVGGEEGFFQLVKNMGKGGRFRIEYRASSIPATMDKDNNFLMMEAVRRLDEENR